MMMAPFRVLYVDDEPALLEIAKIFLERTGNFTVDTLTSARQAVIYVKTQQYDAIISDYQMPEMDGIEFLKLVRNSGNTLPFILFTGRGREEVVIQALNEGADFYLQKGGDPLSQFTELTHKIRQAIQQRLAEGLRHESEEKFRGIFDAINDGIEIHDFEPGEKPGKFLDLNDVACRMLQYTREELLERGPFDFITGYHSRPLDVILGELDTTGHSIFETEHRRKDGTIVPVEIHVHIGHLQGKRVAISVVRDITERKLAEKVLQEEEAKYRRIYETALEGIWGVDTGYRVIFVNPKMARMLGYPPEEILGHSVSDFVVPEEKNDAVQLFEHHRTGMKEQFERRYVRKDGTIITLLVSASPIFDENGTFTGSFAMFTDITERKQAEKALRLANSKLNLLTGITRHDILNKISIILGYLQIAQMKVNDPEIADYLNKIDSAIAAIKSQIEFTRVYQDLGTHEPQWLALDEVMPRS
jgi:PAS domain S-box-containing protein